MLTNTDGFLRRERAVEIAGDHVPFISASDTLLLSCISVAKAFFNREPCAGYVCDVRASANRPSEAEPENLLDYAAGQGLADTLLLGLRASDVLLGGTLLSERGTRILQRIDNADLFHMVIAPWLSSLRWPQRRTVLWELCGRAPVRYWPRPAGRLRPISAGAFSNGRQSVRRTAGEDRFGHQGQQIRKNAIREVN